MDRLFPRSGSNGAGQPQPGAPLAPGAAPAAAQGPLPAPGAPGADTATTQVFPAAGTPAQAQAQAPAGVAQGTVQTQPQPPAAPTTAELQARRQRLAQELADRQWDLGGLTYEMAVRDHFRLDVLVAHAAKLQEIDAELAEIERLLRLEEAGAAGECPACGAPHSRGAVYCWSCGTQLIPVQDAGT